MASATDGSTDPRSAPPGTSHSHSQVQRRGRKAKKIIGRPQRLTQVPRRPVCKKYPSVTIAARTSMEVYGEAVSVSMNRSMHMPAMARSHPVSPSR